MVIQREVHVALPATETVSRVVGDDYDFRFELEDITSQIHGTVTIETPVENVLEFVDDPENLAKCAPMVERVVGWVGAGGAWRIHSESSTEYSGCPSTRNSELLDSSLRAGIHLTVDSRSGKRFMGA